MKKEYKKGVTLIELLVVLMLISVFSAVFISYLSKQSLKGRDAKRKAQISLIRSALEIYRNNNDIYPPDNGSGSINGCGTLASPTTCSWGTSWSQTNAQGSNIVYMKELPDDPKKNDGWHYSYKRNATSSQKYYLCSKLENTIDADYLSSAPDCSSYNYETTEP